MSQFRIISDPVVSQWVIERLGEDDMRTPNDLGAHVSFGVLKNGAPVAGIIYNWYRQLRHGGDMRVIVAADNPCWCLPGILRELFRYPFEVAGCSRLTAVIRDGNERSLKLCLGLGFRREGVLRRGYDGKTNAIVLGMLKSECKWLQRGLEQRVNDEQERWKSATGARSIPNSGGARTSKRPSDRRERAGQYT